MPCQCARAGQPCLAWQAQHIISKPGYYYITFLLFRSDYDTISFHYNTVISFFCKHPVYYFSLLHYLERACYFTYNTSLIIAIIAIINYYLHHSYHKLLFIIFFEDYYFPYFSRTCYCNYCY
jgi:hypothetical protein